MLYKVKYNPYIILLSFAIAFVGSYIAVSLCEHVRLDKKDCPSTNFKKQITLILTSCSLGGVAIWGMYFVAIHSLILTNPITNQVESLYFNVSVVIASFGSAVFFAYIGLWISSRDVVFAKSKDEIVRLFVQNAATFSMKQVRSITTRQILLFSATKELQHLVVGGIMAGVGANLMYGISMNNMIFHGNIRWNHRLFPLSIMIGITASTFAFWILFRLLSLYPKRESLRISATFIMACAVCGMHYTGMAAASFEVSDKLNNPDLNGSQLSEKQTFTRSVLAVFIFSWIVVMRLLCELRNWLHFYMIYVHKIEIIVEDLRTQGGPSTFAKYDILKRNKNCTIDSSIADHSSHNLQSQSRLISHTPNNNFISAFSSLQFLFTSSAEKYKDMNSVDCKEYDIESNNNNNNNQTKIIVNNSITNNNHNHINKIVPVNDNNNENNNNNNNNENIFSTLEN
eukprot:gene8942-12059_t